MRTRVNGRSSILVLLCALCAHAFAQGAQEFDKFARTMLPKVAKAYAARDLKFIDAMLAPDFVGMTSAAGRRSKKDAMADLKRLFGGAQTIKMSSKLLSTKLNGKDGVTVTLGHIVVLTKPGVMDARAHTVVIDTQQRNTWTRSGAGWRLKRIDELKPPKRTIDGRSVAATAHRA